MSTYPLALNTSPARQSRPRSRSRRLTRAGVAKMGAVDQMVQAFSAGNRLSASMGIVLGGFVPVAVYALVHCEVAEHPRYWAMAIGGLIYSAISVYHWAE